MDVLDGAITNWNAKVLQRADETIANQERTKPVRKVTEFEWKFLAAMYDDNVVGAYVECQNCGCVTNRTYLCRECNADHGDPK